jgi:hypothetical protein
MSARDDDRSANRYRQARRAARPEGAAPRLYRVELPFWPEPLLYDAEANQFVDADPAVLAKALGLDAADAKAIRRAIRRLPLADTAYGVARAQDGTVHGENAVVLCPVRQRGLRFLGGGWYETEGDNAADVSGFYLADVALDSDEDLTIEVTSTSGPTGCTFPFVGPPARTVIERERRKRSTRRATRRGGRR